MLPLGRRRSISQAGIWKVTINSESFMKIVPMMHTQSRSKSEHESVSCTSRRSNGRWYSRAVNTVFRQSESHSRARGLSFIAKVFALLLLVSFPMHALAQGVSTGAEATSEAAAEISSDLAMLSIVAAQREGPNNTEEAAAETSSAQTETTPPEIQDTFNSQDGIVSDVLQAAENPENATSTESEFVTVPPLDPSATSTPESEVPLVLGEATSTDLDGNDSEEQPVEEDVIIPGPASLEVVDEDIVAEDIINPDVVDELRVIVPTPIESVAEIPLEEEKGFAFALTGKSIPTKQRLLTSDGEVIDERVIRESPVLSIDDEGAMTIAGACGDSYYVVLLYKDPEDYEKDPRSYILNRAYECTGTFSYAVENLPTMLPNGTYYLLIGEQGEAGAWVPITSLTEITINRK